MEIVIVISIVVGLLFGVVRLLDHAADQATREAIEKENDHE